MAENFDLRDENILTVDDVLKYKLLGQGNTAEIFLYKDVTVLKLFRDGFPQSGIMKEWNVTRAVQKVYGRMPKALRLVRCGERAGILYELAEGQDLFRMIGSNPFLLLKAGKKLAELHAEIHKKEIDGILTVKEKLCQEIGWVKELSEDEKQKIIDRLLLLPDNKQLCHFDFHPGNIMVSVEKTLVLDWLTACSGESAADIARTCILLKYGEIQNGDRLSELILSITKACIRGAYIRNVLRLSRITRYEIKQWFVPVAAARLSEWLTEHEKERLLKLIRKHLYE